MHHHAGDAEITNPHAAKLSGPGESAGGEMVTFTAGTRMGRYEIGSLLGVGGMGEVYLARDTQLERDVALKVLPAAVASDQKRMARFKQEARAASTLNHPN